MHSIFLSIVIGWKMIFIFTASEFFFALNTFLYDRELLAMHGLQLMHILPIFCHCDSLCKKACLKGLFHSFFSIWSHLLLFNYVIPFLYLMLSCNKYIDVSSVIHTFVHLDSLVWHSFLILLALFFNIVFIFYYFTVLPVALFLFPSSCPLLPVSCCYGYGDGFLVF